ncbi:MAG: nitroreductase family protein [archaeon]|nr:MAG: nitroreductase family protein [archaeon]
MDVFDAITGRRSVRKYENRPVDQEKLGMILDACRWAPSAGNRQPWEVVIVDDPEKIEKLAEAALEQMWMKTAPVILAVCINENIAKGTYGDRSDQYALQTIGMAVENMMLAAHCLGLGSCCVTAFEESEVRNIIECTEFIKPVALVTVGYSREEPPVPYREEIAEFTHYNSYREQYMPGLPGAFRKKRGLRKKLYDSLKNL